MLNQKMRKIYNSIYYTNPPLERGSQEDYINSIENGSFDDHFVYGVSDKEKGFLKAFYFQAPNALYCGSMGSGKSIAVVFTLATHFATNSHNSIYLCYDQGKSMGDFSPFFSYDNVVKALGDPSKITPLMDMLYEEMMKRQKIFKDWGLSGLLEYEIFMKERYILYKVQQNNFDINDLKDLVKKNLIGMDSTAASSLRDKLKNENKFNNEDIEFIHRHIDLNSDMLMKEEYKGLGRIVTVMEEFSLVISSPQMNFHRKYETYGSTAYKFENLMKLGRSYGLFFLFATQRAVVDHVPSQIKPGILTYLCFKMNNMGDAAGITGVEHAQEIEEKHPGRCATKGGAFVQFPYIDKPYLVNFLKKYYKPFEAELFSYQLDDYRKAFEMEGNSGMTKIKPIRELVENYTEYDAADIVTRILEDLKYDVSKQTNRAFMAELIAEKLDKKYAVKIYGNERMFPDKELSNMKEYLSSMECDAAIVFFFENLNGVDKKIEGLGSEWKGVDKIDLIQIGDVLSNKDKLESVGKYKDLYPKLKLSNREDIGLLSEEDQLEADQLESEFSLQEIIDDALSSPEKPEIKPRKTKSFLGRRKEIKDIES